MAERSHHSSISASSRPRHPASGVATFIGTFALLSLAGFLGAHVISPQASSPTPDGLPDSPSGPDWYVAYDTDNIQRDHYIFYTAFGSAIENARKANVLILGNSRAQFGFEPGVLADASVVNGASFYNMGFGWNESYVFPLDIILRYDLRPQWMIVNADVSVDGSFFRSEPSTFAAAILRQGSWSATTFTYDKVWGSEVQADLGLLFPYLLPQASGPVIYRSWSNGFWWRPAKGRQAGAPSTIPVVADGTPSQQALEAANAREFVRQMHARGACVVFTAVPGYGLNRARALALAEEARVPFISPELDGLRIFDASHLDFESAARFTRAFLDDFRKLGPCVTDAMMGPFSAR